MSIYVATSQEARSNFATNRGSRWHQQGATVENGDSQLAFQRLRQPLFQPFISPGFKLRRTDQLFAIGSCFARGIEKVLLNQKMNVVSAAPEFAALQPVNKEVTGLGFTNKYNTFSILNELRWALDPAAEFPRESIVEIGDGLFSDPHITPTLQLAGLEETLRRRSLLQAANQRIAECDAIIITLGLAEVWRDKLTDTYLNMVPHREALKMEPARYEFHVTNFSQNLSNLEEIYALLRLYGKPNVQFVVTVSPVPLMSTFSKADVVVANTYSKSMLRTVAEEWAGAHANVHYFPSYEIVQNSDRAVTWAEDLRHVQGRVVNQIMRLFLEESLEVEATTDRIAAPVEEVAAT